MNRLFVLIGLLCASTSTQAITFCAHNTADLVSALTSAAASIDNDTIRLEAGTYTSMPPVSANINGNLTISGGWNSTCSAYVSNSSLTRLNGGSTNTFRLAQRRGDLGLSRVHFSGWDRVHLSDFPAFGGVSGEISVDRARFSDTTVGLLTDPTHHNVRIENSIFHAHTDAGLRIHRASDSLASARVLVQFNTITAPTAALGFGLDYVADVGAPQPEASVYNTLMDGNFIDLRIERHDVLLRHSFWNSDQFAQSGGLAAGSNSNLDGDPQIDAAFQPIEPNSPLINSGIALAGELPPRDYNGDQRLIGLVPDIGAHESSIAGVTTFTVTSAANTGAGSLRSVITNANALATDAIINFNIPGSCPHLINLTSALPAISKSVQINGYTQPGSQENDDSAIFDGNVCVFLIGDNAIANGLRITTDSSADEAIISGLGFYGFTSEAILISGPGKAFVRGNWFGVGGGLVGLGQSFANTIVRVQDAPGSVIGGLTRADRNVIVGGEQFGVRLEASALGQRRVENNLIGVTTNGTSAAANAVGVYIADSANDRVAFNVIANSDAQAVLLASGAQSTRIFRNRLGANALSLTAGGNGGNAVRVTSGDAHQITQNTINNNQTDGIAVLSPSRRVLIADNTFANNAALPIDLSPNGWNPIDLDVGQTGANDQINRPTVVNASGSGSQGEAQVRISSANGTYTVQVYASTACEGGGLADAERIVSSNATLTLTCAGTSFNCTDNVLVPLDAPDAGFSLIGKAITALVWDEENNTSEMSDCRLYTLGDLVFRDGFE